MTAAEYWRERARRAEEQSFLRGEALMRRLYALYRSAAREIRQDIADFYLRYADEQKITLADAQKRLNSKELREWKKTVEEYLEEIGKESDPDVRKRLEADYRGRYYASRITRLDALHGEIGMELSRLAAKCEGELRRELTAAMQTDFQGSLEMQTARTGGKPLFTGLDAKMIEETVRYPWSGAGFSDRIWKNRDALGFQLQELLTKGLIAGQSGAAIASKLADAEGQSFKAAERLVRTETARIHAEADRRAYEAAGIEEFEFMASLDERTCPVCGALDGKHFPVSDAVTGKNDPPLHPNCRCCTVGYFPDEERDGEDRTYAEWAAEYDKKHGEGSLDRARKMAYNESKDREQYERYAELLGKDAPESFEEFQRLKYEDADAYAEIKALANSKNYLQQHLDFEWNGKKEFLPRHVKFDKVVTIAGAGTNQEIHDIARLIHEYGGQESDWMKRSGRVSSSRFVFDVHWYERDDKIQHDVKLKMKKEK